MTKGIQVGIQFVQIGNDPGATRYLQELDDQLQGQHGIRVSHLYLHLLLVIDVYAMP